MMKDLIREAPVGQLLRFITGNRVLLYPEEQPDFVLPDFYQKALNIRSKSSCSSANSSVIPIKDDVQTNKGSGGDLEKSIGVIASERRCPSPITSDGSILVDWYTEDDQANPKNWSNCKRAIVAAMIVRPFLNLSQT
jgi:DHA1 family multidrug resistance protein-like MFS transporter